MSEALLPVAPNVRLLPLELIDPSPHNPRKHFGDLEELAADLKLRGIILPLIVRPFGSRFELVAGERRLRAAKKAGLKEAPAIVRELGDKEARELQLAENLQREDLNAAEEADGYEELRKDFGYSIKDLALKFHRSESSIKATLKLRDLGAAGRTALAEERISASVGLLIARIPGELQERAVNDLASSKDQDAMSYREAIEHIQRNFMLQLERASFDLADAELVAKAGPCTKCPKRTGNQRELFPDVKADVCTDPACFRAKTDALVERKFAAAEKSGQTVLRGKRAAALFERFGGLKQTADYVEVKGQHYVKNRGWIDVERLLKSAPEVPRVLVAEPNSGKVLEVVPIKALPPPATKKAAKARAPAKETAAQKEARLSAEKLRHEKEAAAMAFLGQLVKRAEKKLGKPELLVMADALAFHEEILLLRRANKLPGELSWAALDKMHKDFRKALPKMAEEDLRGVVFELVLAVQEGDVDELADGDPSCRLVQIGKALGLKFVPPAPAKAQKK